MNLRTRVAVVAALACTAGLTVVAAPAHAGVVAPPDLSIDTGTVTVHTANGRAWQLSLSVDQDGATVTSGGGTATSSSTDAIRATLARSVSTPTRGQELHEWSIGRMSTSILSFDPGTGDGVLKTPARTSHVMSIDLGFHATSSRSATCRSGSETTYLGTLTGQATLVTGLAKGGTVGGQNVTFPAGTTQLNVDNGCVPPSGPTTTTCSKFKEYEGISKTKTSVFGLQGGALNLAEVAHTVALASPANAARNDVVLSQPATAPAFYKSAKLMQISTSTSGLITGSAKITRGTIMTRTKRCTLNGKQHTLTQYENDTATFTNTAGHPIVGHTTLTVPLTIANGSRAGYFVVTWK